MRSLPRAHHHVVTISRPSGEEAHVELAPLPVGFATALETVFPPPVEYLNGKPQPNEAASNEYLELKGLVLIAKCIMGEYVVTTPEPNARATRAEWDAYARRVRDEFRDAGFTPGDVVAVMRGVSIVNEGSGLGKASSSPTRE
jgi:hypothetical protein